MAEEGEYERTKSSIEAPKAETFLINDWKCVSKFGQSILHQP